MANTATSMYFNDGDRVSYPSGPDNIFTFRNGDFTIDFWGRGTSTDQTRGWFSYFLNSTNRFYLANYSYLVFIAFLGELRDLLVSLIHGILFGIIMH